jgi:hypothetical protein
LILNTEHSQLCLSQLYSSAAQTRTVSKSFWPQRSHKDGQVRAEHLALNCSRLDAAEIASFGIGVAVVARGRSGDDLAAFFQDHAVKMD